MKPTSRLIPPAAAKRLIAICTCEDFLERARPHFTPVDRWKSCSDADLWRAVVSQVCVVGSSARWEQLADSGDLALISIEALSPLSAEQRGSAIHGVLRKHGIRYVTDEPRSCKKTQALVANFEFVQHCGGAQSYLGRLAALPDDAARVKRIRRDFEYIAHKGARDFLITFDLGRSLIAFDVRVLNVLEAAGVKAPADVQSNNESYEQLQSALLERVCGPAKITGAQFDRILYRNYAGLCAAMGIHQDE
ncbi:MAG: hypothetical protein JNK05_04350 [Myxococcales bacterium]|nr:hypothetical protein [Myxococcales bacterium]